MPPRAIQQSQAYCTSLADVVEAADAAVVIPMLGMANALNVATAAAILSVASGLPPSPAARVSTAPASEKKSKSGRQPAGSTGWLKTTPERKMSYPQGSELSEDRLGGGHRRQRFGTSGVEPNGERWTHGRGESFRSRLNQTLSPKLAISLTGPGKQFWGCFTKQPVLPKQTTRRPSKWLTNYRLNYEPRKIG